MSSRPDSAPGPAWQFWIDVGGTFTDCLARGPDGTLHRRKVLSSSRIHGRGMRRDRKTLWDEERREAPDDFWKGYTLWLFDDRGQVQYGSRVVASRSEELVVEDDLPVAAADAYSYGIGSDEPAPLLAARLVTRTRRHEPLPPLLMRLGTTRGTNALLTRRGARTAFITTRGFADILRIGYQDRPRLFDLDIRKPPPLFVATVELDERMNADGTVQCPLDESQVRSHLAALQRQGIEAIAICLLHAYVNDAHERVVARVAAEFGFRDVSRSSEVAPIIKIVARGDTTVANAYLNPILRDYLRRLEESLGQSSELRVLTSAGGLVRAAAFQGKDSILSGPAGGVVGFARSAQAAGFARSIGFDMGGTSTDVSRFDGRFELDYETQKAGVRVVAPAMAIETVAAGGGSICDFDGTRLTVGPESAGADPGPACYGRGGPLTITDLNVLLGRIPADRFPFPLDRLAPQRRLEALRDEISRQTAHDYSLEELAEGWLAIANAHMAEAIRSISVAKGYDPRDYVLAAFGGAAPQHACHVASLLSVRRVLIHPHAGLLSAWGIGMADITRHKVAGIYQSWDDACDRLEAYFRSLESEARREVAAEGVPMADIVTHRALELRFRGLDASLTIHRPDDGDYRREYLREHQRCYGYVPEGRPVEIVTARVEAVGMSREQATPSRPAPQRPANAAERTEKAYFDGQWHDTPLFPYAQLEPGMHLAGPCIVTDPYSTIVIPPGWQAEVYSGRELILTPSDVAVNDTHNQPLASDTAAPSTPPDPIALEIFHNQFAAIAEQMGITLRNTACSVNVKERLDFSCAVFTGKGDLVANAPHIPVHLGAMSETVKALLRQNRDLRAGDVFVTNDPYQGGSHLPDITVVTPVFTDNDDHPCFITASRAHHAEIGGITPGSMPPRSRCLAEEGVWIRNFALGRAGRMHWGELRALLLSGPYPTRRVEDNLADIAAQVAANHQGARQLLELVGRHGKSRVAAYMEHIQAAAATKMRKALARLAPGRRSFVDYLDDGSPIAVSITIDGECASIDFTGTGPVLDNNLNANRAIVTAAVMYCFRCLLHEDIPLNQGVLHPLSIHVPECLLNPQAGPTSETSPAVAGGNVETSQRVVDVLLGALDAAAASQGTMNNFSFGNESFGYYETICGGAGATSRASGASAVHTHMTNTRLTDPEVLEQRFPVRLLEFSIRRGSGGDGHHRGGDGVVRRVEFLADLDVSIVSQRRGVYPPFGLHGGQPGAVGRQILERADGTSEVLPAITQVRVRAGDRLTMETPGGGGWGKQSH